MTNDPRYLPTPTDNPRGQPVYSGQPGVSDVLQPQPRGAFTAPPQEREYATTEWHLNVAGGDGVGTVLRQMQMLPHKIRAAVVTNTSAETFDLGLGFYVPASTYGIIFIAMPARDRAGVRVVASAAGAGELLIVFTDEPLGRSLT